MRESWWLGVLLLFACLAAPAKDIAVAEGFVLQPLDPTDGQIARPRDWFYASEGTPSGWMWTISREDTRLGPYDVGMRVQLMMGVEAQSGLTRPAFVQQFIEGKRAAGVQVVRDCPVQVEGEFHRRCFEVVEPLELGGKRRDFHILYSLSWATAMDMVAVTIAGAPVDEWRDYRATFDKMADIRLIGPAFAGGAGLGASQETVRAPAPFSTVYNRITPESEARADDATLKGLYTDRFRFVDIAPRPGLVGAKVTGGSLPPRAFAVDGTELTGEVLLAFIVSPDGKVVEPRFVSISDERLRATVLAAVAAWRFEPATLDGKPVATLAAQEFSFKSGVER